MFDKVEYVICVHVHAPTPPARPMPTFSRLAMGAQASKPYPTTANRLPDWHRLKDDLFGKLHKVGNSPTCSSKALSTGSQ